MNGAEITKNRSNNLRAQFLASNVHFNHLSFHLQGSRNLP